MPVSSYSALDIPFVSGSLIVVSRFLARNSSPGFELEFLVHAEEHGDHKHGDDLNRHAAK
jgi:hypothetical protein